MKTEDLIAALAADTAPRSGMPDRLRRAFLPALIAAAAAFLLLWGLRADLSGALASAALLKTLLPLALAATGLWLAHGLARPEARPRAQAAAVLGAAGLALAGLAAALAQGGLAGLAAALSTSSLWVCLGSVPTLAVLPLAALLWALTAGATLHPARAGATAGLTAGAAAATLYSLYCTEDAALFWLPAYGAAIGLVTLSGALAGARLLRW